MNVIVTTHMQQAPNGTVDPAQYEDEFTVGLNRRMGKDAKPTGWRFFSSMAVEGMAWDGRHLKIHSIAPDLPKVDIDLTWNEGPQTWDGLFELDGSREQISLRRPSSKSPVSQFVGTWFDHSELMNNCLHITQQNDGGLAVWADDIQLPGQNRYASGIQAPTQTLEHYGEIAKAAVNTPNAVNIELRAYTPICCSHSFTATLSAGGESMKGNWFAGPNQAPRAVKWQKMASNSCMNVIGADGFRVGRSAQSTVKVPPANN